MSASAPTRRLGASSLELTTVGLGTWALGGGDWAFSWGAQDDAESVRTIHAALEAGINWIDTAPIYGLGHSEKIVGRALAEWSGPRPVVASKCGRVWDDVGRVGGRLTPRSVRQECEDSLRRLGRDCIDLYQVHWPDPDQEIEYAWEEMARLMAEEKIRYAGVSNFSMEQIQRCQSIHPVASLQPPYSMLRRDVEEDLLPFCAQEGMGLLAYSPLQKGLLTGKISRQRVAGFPEDDHRRNDPMFNEPRLSKILAQVEQLGECARRRNISSAQLSIAWVLRRSEMTSAIVGARHPAQVTETAPAMGVELSENDLLEIDSILQG